MRTFPAIYGVLALALALGACERPSGPAGEPANVAAPSAATAFSHAVSDDQSGFYIPVTAPTIGKYQLSYLSLGQATEFASWEAGERMATYAPVMFEFDDTSSSMVTGETGAETRSVTVRVLPTSYSVTDGAVRFSGSSPELGAVSFEGSLDQGALATARRNLGGGEAPVLTGTLRVGGRTFANQEFRWFGGD